MLFSCNVLPCPSSGPTTSMANYWNPSEVLDFFGFPGPAKCSGTNGPTGRRRHYDVLTTSMLVIESVLQEASRGSADASFDTSALKARELWQSQPYAFEITKTRWKTRYALPATDLAETCSAKLAAQGEALTTAFGDTTGACQPTAGRGDSCKRRLQVLRQWLNKLCSWSRSGCLQKILTSPTPDGRDSQSTVPRHHLQPTSAGQSFFLLPIVRGARPPRLESDLEGSTIKPPRLLQETDRLRLPQHHYSSVLRLKQHHRTFLLLGCWP